ncbi:MAG: xanthine dehydrogenase family protein subunit M [Chloroflexota bacterium]|nr:MAG: carbon monoxide dehydrogenase [Chloroflexota bacterium]
MLPQQFDYVAPVTVEEAVQALSATPNARFLAGSFNLLIDIKTRRVAPPLLVDLRKIPALHGIERTASGLRIGSMTTLSQLLEDEEIRGTYVALAEALEKTGDPQIRNQDAIGGHLEYASPSSDISAALVALGASIDVTGPNGSRAIPADDFFTGLRQTALAPGELITAVTLPAGPARSAYEKLKHPAHLGAICGVAVALWLDGDQVARCRLAVTGATDHAQRLPAAEAALTGWPLVEPRIAEAAAHAADGLTGISDLQFSADYRLHMIGVLLRRALVHLRAA